MKKFRPGQPKPPATRRNPDARDRHESRGDNAPSNSARRDHTRRTTGATAQGEAQRGDARRDDTPRRDTPQRRDARQGATRDAGQRSEGRQSGTRGEGRQGESRQGEKRRGEMRRGESPRSEARPIEAARDETRPAGAQGEARQPPQPEQRRGIDGRHTFARRVESQGKPRREAHDKPRREAHAKPRSEAHSQPRNGAYNQPRNEAQDQPRHESRYEPRRESQGQPRRELLRDARRESRDESSREARQESRGEPHGKSSVEVRVEPQVEAEAEESHLYGVLPVLEALRAGNRRIERITIAEGASEARLHEVFELAREYRVQVRRAPRAELQRLVTTGANHQGIVAHVAAVAYREADELTASLAARVGTDAPPLAVVLDGVEDPRNLGAIIRTAECAGVHGLFVPERRAVGLTETVAKASAGALEYLPVARVVNIARLIEEFKERGIWTIGTDADAEITYTDWDWTHPCALLLGGEGAGLRRLVRERCDALVKIPLHGQIASLNVSVAAGIVLYEAMRQRTAARALTYEEGRVGDGDE